MTDAELAALYASAFPDDRKPWRANDIAKLRRDPNKHILTTSHAALFGSIAADEAEIISLFTDPNHRRAGYAHGLLKQFMQICTGNGVRQVFLEVATDNYAACKLYKSFDFFEVGKRKAYYERQNGARVDALIFRHLI